MKHNPIILASKSPRRKAILEECNIPFTVDVGEVDEYYDTTLLPEQAIEQIALQKAQAVMNHHSNDTVIGCDTMVILDQKALGKPSNKQEAETMLRALCAHTHTVISGVAIVTSDTQLLFHEKTEVTFYEVDEALLHDYLQSDEPYDKAGAYGIQGKGKLFVKEIHGDYYNVVGMPIARIVKELKKHNLL